jgi:hypothetical protein
VGPRVVLDAVVKRKIPIPRRKSNPRTPIVQPNNEKVIKFTLVETELIVEKHAMCQVSLNGET